MARLSSEVNEETAGTIQMCRLKVQLADELDVFVSSANITIYTPAVLNNAQDRCTPF